MADNTMKDASDRERALSYLDMANIADRMGKSRAYAGTYRKRMLRQGIIGERRRGYVGFDLPLFGEFLAQKDADGGLT